MNKKFDNIDINYILNLRNEFYSFNELMMQYNSALLEITTKFQVLNNEFSLKNKRNPIESIKSRLKSPESTLKKIYKRNLELSIESIETNLFDIAGVRVICSFPDDIYILSQSLLKQDDIKLIEMKDYIKNPKPNGYRSLHLIVAVPIFLSDKKKEVIVEIQFRTIAMDFWASLEHKLRYKKNIVENEYIEKELKKCADDIAMLDTRMQNIRNEIDRLPH